MPTPAPTPTPTPRPTPSPTPGADTRTHAHTHPAADTEPDAGADTRTHAHPAADTGTDAGTDTRPRLRRGVQRRCQRRHGRDRSLSSFLESHDGQHVALAVNGTYRVSNVAITAHHLTVDFRGSRLQGSVVGDPVLEVQTSTDIVLNDPRVSGTGYAWNDGTQYEHGIAIDGGSDITLNRPVTRDTRGDGIYVGYSRGWNSPRHGCRHQ